MKVQCDVCNREEASLFCSADEAALCHGCDHRVHHANKLASKHNRFSLLHPSVKDAPRCDVCQERRAILFCQEDRAILCRECDLPIHTANEHTEKHNRFLLTGVKLSSCSSSIPILSSPKSSTSSSNCSDTVVDLKANNSNSQILMKKPIPVSSPQLDPPLMETITTPLTKVEGSTSSISEYLMEMLPGWHVEDFLDPSQGFCKIDDAILPFLDSDLESNLSFSADEMAIWVPKITQPPIPHQAPPHFNGYNSSEESKGGDNPKSNKRWNDDGFMVPQISPPSMKRSRHIW